MAGMLSQASYAWAWGIPGVFEVGGGSITIGPLKTDIPNCGGDICNGLEHAKNQLNGEAERKASEGERDQAQRELNQARTELDAAIQQLTDLTNQTKKQNEEFVLFKQTTLQASAEMQRHLMTNQTKQESARELGVQAQGNLRDLKANVIKMNAAVKAVAVKISQLSIVNQSEGDLEILNAALSADNSFGTDSELVLHSIRSFAAAQSQGLATVEQVRSIVNDTANPAGGDTLPTQLETLQTAMTGQHRQLEILQKTNIALNKLAVELAAQIAAQE